MKNIIILIYSITCKWERWFITCLISILIEINLQFCQITVQLKVLLFDITVQVKVYSKSRDLFSTLWMYFVKLTLIVRQTCSMNLSLIGTDARKLVFMLSSESNRSLLLFFLTDHGIVLAERKINFSR